jgi:hypothetical protein
MRWIEICLQVGCEVGCWLAYLPGYGLLRILLADARGPFDLVYMETEVERGIVRYISTYTRREIPQCNRCAAWLCAVNSKKDANFSSFQ